VSAPQPLKPIGVARDPVDHPERRLEGQRMLERVGGFMREVGLIVRSHHERFDGGGYPDGLAAEAIPFESRIVACCDTWNAMRTNRSYRQALAYDVALAELQQTQALNSIPP
jgi:polar amino acid transport system substrate-binding protein